MDGKLAITLPFFPDPYRTPSCECYPEYLRWRFRGCNGCPGGTAFAKLRLKALKQTKKQWAWFAKAKKLDDERGTELGTLGYLPREVRAEIFRYLILDSVGNPFVNEYNIVPGFDITRCWSWPATYGTFDLWGKPGKVICSHDEDSDDWFRTLPFHERSYRRIPFRNATIDTRFEVDDIIFSALTFEYTCPSILRRFLADLSTTQRSQLRSINLHIFDCDHCLHKGMSREASGWRRVCDQLPSNLISVNFLLGRWAGAFCGRGRALRLEEIDPTRQRAHVERTKELLEALSCQIRRTAVGTKIALTTRGDYRGRFEKDEFDKLVLAVQQSNEKWSDEFVEWKKGLEFAEG